MGFGLLANPLLGLVSQCAIKYQIAQVGSVTQVSAFFLKKILQYGSTTKKFARAGARNAWSPNYGKKTTSGLMSVKKISFPLLIMLGKV